MSGAPCSTTTSRTSGVSTGSRSRSRSAVSSACGTRSWATSCRISSLKRCQTTRGGTLPGRNPGTFAVRPSRPMRRSISASTASLGIAMVRRLRVSLTSANSTFILLTIGSLRGRVQRSTRLSWMSDDPAGSPEHARPGHPGAKGGIRTPTASRLLDPKSSASASSATFAYRKRPTWSNPSSVARGFAGGARGMGLGAEAGFGSQKPEARSQKSVERPVQLVSVSPLLASDYVSLATSYFLLLPAPSPSILPPA